MRAAAVLALGLALGACAPVQETIDEATRAQAKSVVTPIVKQNFPGTNAVSVSDCVIENASTGEILSVASASVTGVTEGTLRTVTEVLGRPETLNCIVRENTSLFLEDPSRVLSLPQGL